MFIYVLTIFFSLRVYFFLRKQSNLISSESKSFHLQISLTIGIQALTPFFVYYWPNMIAWSMMFCGPWWKEIVMEKGLSYPAMFISYSLIPLTNPLIAILMISSYRHALLTIIVRIFNVIYLKTTSNLQSTTSSQASSPVIIL